jgi:hypothetical protein
MRPRRDLNVATLRLTYFCGWEPVARNRPPTVRDAITTRIADYDRNLKWPRMRDRDARPG